MLVAPVLALTFLGRRVRRWVAILGGLGITDLVRTAGVVRSAVLAATATGSRVEPADGEEQSPADDGLQPGVLGAPLDGPG